MGNFEEKYITYFSNDEFNQSAPKWLNNFRLESLNSFKDIGIPKITDEDWRFTDLKDFLTKDFLPLNVISNKFDMSELPEFLTKLDAHFICIVNGTLVSSTDLDFKVVSLKDGITNEDQNLKRIILDEFSSRNKDCFYELNSAFLENGFYIEIEKLQKIEKPIVIVNKFDSNSSNAFINPRNILYCGESSSAEIVEYSFSDSNESYFLNKTTMMYLDANSKVEHLSIEDGSRSSFVFSNLKIKQDRESNLTTNSILMGGKLIRNNVHPILDGDTSYSSILGLYLPQDSQLMDNYMFVEHSKPHCDSRQLYKGLLKDSSRGVFHGRIVVHEDAQKTDAKQTNKNLLLSNSAQVDTKPQLEIYADDVKCTHGATTGQLDKEALHYLRARGISKDKAVSMLVRAFTDEVSDALTSKNLANLYRAVVREWFISSNLIEEDE